MYATYDMYCSRVGILLRMVPTLVRSEHVPKHEVRVLEFLAELALAIPPELAHAISLDLACALDGGDPPHPCSLVLYYLCCPTHSCDNSAVVEPDTLLAVLSPL